MVAENNFSWVIVTVFSLKQQLKLSTKCGLKSGYKECGYYSDYSAGSLMCLQITAV